MTDVVPSLTLTSPDETAKIAAQIGAQLICGDTLLLEGDIGAGKSYFARALIQSLQDIPEDVPSPTFTLVQTYDTRRGEIWHADLYRLSEPGEAEELGLTDAFTNAICLIEWPDRLAGLKPSNAITFTFKSGDTENSRYISFTGGTTDLRNRISKALT